MSTRFIRKRYRRVIPIGEARLRESYLARGATHRHRSRYYPLYETAESIYNYENLMECLRNWNEYSADTEDNVNNSANILKIMASHDGSTVQNLYEATRVICHDILPYVEHPSKYENVFSKLEGDKLQESKSTILDKLYILKECDRVLENYKTISNVVDPIEYFRQDLKIRSLSESLYRFCDIIEDNFNLEYPANFCIAMESALYALDHLVEDEVDKRRVSEGVIDYYLVNGGNENLNKFAESLDYCLQKDEFLPNEINDYMLYIQQVMNKDQIMQEAVEEYFNSTTDLQLIDDYNNLMRNNAYDVVQEFQIFDKAKEIFTKFKALPNKTVATVKEAINALFVTSRVQDMKKNTLNALSIIFYFLMGLGIAVGIGGVVGGLLGLLVTLNIHHATNKEYLQDAIEGWTKHKHDVERRLRTAQGDERNKLSDYLEEVDKNITILSNKYESMRDETSDEISSRAAADSHAHPSDDLTNPMGHNPLSATKQERNPVKEEMEILNEFNMLSTDEIITKLKNRIKLDLSPKDKKEIKSNLLGLLEAILFIGSIGLVMTAEFPTFVNIIIIITAFTLINILDIIDKSECQSLLTTWTSHIDTVNNKIKNAKGEEKSRLTSYKKALNKGLVLMQYAISIPKNAIYTISDFSSLTKNIDLLFTSPDAFISKYKTLIQSKFSKATPTSADHLIFFILQVTLMVIFTTYAAQAGMGMIGQIVGIVGSLLVAQLIYLNFSGKFVAKIFSGFSKFEENFKSQIDKISSEDKSILKKSFDIIIKIKEDLSKKIYSPRLGR